MTNSIPCAVEFEPMMPATTAATAIQITTARTSFFSSCFDMLSAASFSDKEGIGFVGRSFCDLSVAAILRRRLRDNLAMRIADTPFFCKLTGSKGEARVKASIVARRSALREIDATTVRQSWIKQVERGG